MSTYKWSIEKLVATEGDLVTHVHWRCEKEGFACSGIRNLVSGNSLTPYNKLTEQQVLDWCFEAEVITIENIVDNTTSTITKFLKEEAEAQVTEQINRVKNEPVLPWVKIPA